MSAAFGSEVVKLRQRTYWFALAAMLAFMAIAMVISVGDPGEVASDRGPAGLVLARQDLEAADGLARSLGNAVTFVGVVALAIVALNVGGEYGHGTIRNLLVRQPNRARLLLGKSAALLTFSAAAAVLVALVGIGVAQILARDLDTAAWWSAQGRAASAAGVLAFAVATCGWAALGILFGFVLRSAPAAIGVGIGYALPVEILFGTMFPVAARWLPAQTFQALARGGTPDVDVALAAAGSVAWAVVAVLVALVVFRRRDVEA
ncbi:conserved hypothetical protein [Beutenbergia cavernae DSM 12333]|uniref:ABC transporter permease n=1 Tax=Beutenbergia cavernae (strain ATCC BAA-8 / DSM 12333 / CCUG 43141 / JCM 11478 / NBRC 16432 / NCIMB 13614 / HKI 0122) TaxID=471853 RepID=C5BWG8_BEUC1|nr:ABC transporter permease subunit [Beutenbergia cavernae]ACQ78626.1 conserved hypothetical protein [Beutenbergia cavernae DSM 12333]